jgi:hypothetical protein
MVEREREKERTSERERTSETIQDTQYTHMFSFLLLRSDKL